MANYARPLPKAPPELATSAETSTKSDVGDSNSAPAETTPDVRDVTLTDSTWAELQSLIEQQKGKIVVVDVWSTACEPCMTEFPHLIELLQRFPDDLVAISFDVDYAGMKNKPPAFYRERVLRFLGSQSENSVLHRMCTVAAEDLFNEINLDSIPAVYVYGRDGTLLKRFDGSSGGGESVSYEKQVIPFVGNHVTSATGK